MTDKRDRALGCFIGLAVGDAIAGGGRWGGNTSMALCLAESLLEKRQLDPADLMQRFSNWFMFGRNAHDGRCADIGATTRAALMRFQDIGDPMAGVDDPMTAGDAALARLAPVAVFFHRDGAAAEAAASLQTRTTHGATEAVDASSALVHLLVELIQEGNMPIGVSRRSGSIGHVAHTLHAGMRASDLDALQSTGHDPGVAAVAGQIVGARLGLSGLPEEWRQRIPWSERLHQIAARLFDEAPA